MTTMPRRSKPSWSPIWLTCVLVGLTAAHAHAKDVLTVPQEVSLSADMSTQQLSISWLGGAAAAFDLIILRTELNETVFYETVSVMVNQESGRHQWNWTSVEPLQCTSLSIRIRSRDGQATSDWSNTQILQGSDLPSNAKSQMYPQDKIRPVGASTTFCCIVGEGKLFGNIKYSKTAMNETRLSRRSYAVTAVNQGLSGRTGTNVICSDNTDYLLDGTVVFVGYPPLPRDLVCVTRDLTSAVCKWTEGRGTNLYRKRGTRYSLNNRYHSQQTECSVAQWEGNWTLVAVNPLGRHVLTDSAELGHRVFPVAPENLNSTVRAWNATLWWRWKYDRYSSLALVCQVELTSQGYKTKRNFSGLGLRSVFLSDLNPDEDYKVQVRCGAQQNFWSWGSWSEPLSFKTNTYVPDSLDVWMWMNKDHTGQVIWKPLTRRQSHGPIRGYEVTEENQQPKLYPPDTFSVPINLTKIATAGGDNKVTATVIVKNDAGVSQPASVHIPLRLTDVEPHSVSRAVYTGRGFPLYWQRDDNATCAYVVEWYESFCRWDCTVGWIKVAAGNTNVSVESADFLPGVRYNISLYSSTSEAPELLQRWQGYMQELVPSVSVTLSTTQQDSDILLTWGEIPLVNRRGFLLGYNIYVSRGSQLMLLADWLILEILASLGITAVFLVIVTFVCYKKRKCLVHMVERPEWDSSKEALVVIPEEDEDEDGQGFGDEPADTDEPASLRYYNHVVDERPIRPRFPDSSASSASSLDSARTDVTYTGIQTSGSSLVFLQDSEGHQPQADLSFCGGGGGGGGGRGGGGGGYRPQMQSRALSDDTGLASPEPFFEPEAASAGGYKPQSSWHLDSPVEAEESVGLVPSLGSPTSVASTQFLLPDGDERRQPSSSAATWFSNLLSSTKP
uniref:Fibronectin type-III domain-containing protein n=1 Tax=Cyclopterus lumpus TaxID=8103 RepID=A0A8C2Z2C6_CYCLU